MRSRLRTVVLLLVSAQWACGSAESPPSDPGEAGKPPAATRQAFAVLDKLAGAMANDRADRLIDVADPVHGLMFWGQPGACAAPMLKVSFEENGKLTEIARQRIGSAPPHYFDPNGYWREVAETIRAGLRVAKVNAGRYKLPPEEGLDRAPPWASLDTRDVALGERELACLGDRGKAARAAPRSEYRYRFRAERGYSSVTVFLTEHDRQLKAAHVILVWHYDA